MDTYNFRCSNYLSLGRGAIPPDSVKCHPFSSTWLFRQFLTFIRVENSEFSLTPSIRSIRLMVEVATLAHSARSATDQPIKARPSRVCIPVSASFISMTLIIVTMIRNASSKLDFVCQRSKIDHVSINKPAKYLTTKQALSKSDHLKEIAL